MLARRILKSFCVGMVGTAIIFGIAVMGGHNTLLQIVTMPFTMPLAVLAGVVGNAITKGHAGGTWETIQLYGLMFFFGGIIYGSLAFLVWPRHRNSN
jgi:hypothetical protein